MIEKGSPPAFEVPREKYGLQYVKYKRFLVEIRDEESGNIFYSKRFCFKDTAIEVREHYNKIAGYIAKGFDTKTGEVFECLKN